MYIYLTTPFAIFNSELYNYTIRTTVDMSHSTSQNSAKKPKDKAHSTFPLERITKV